MSKILVSDIYICILATNLRILKVIFKVGLYIFNREFIQSGHISFSHSMYLARGSYPANVNTLLALI